MHLNAMDTYEHIVFFYCIASTTANNKTNLQLALIKFFFFYHLASAACMYCNTVQAAQCRSVLLLSDGALMTLQPPSLSLSDKIKQNKLKSN